MIDNELTKVPSNTNFGQSDLVAYQECALLFAAEGKCQMVESSLASLACAGTCCAALQTAVGVNLMWSRQAGRTAASERRLLQLMKSPWSFASWSRQILSCNAVSFVYSFGLTSAAHTLQLSSQCHYYTWRHTLLYMCKVAREGLDIVMLVKF